MHQDVENVETRFVAIREGADLPLWYPVGELAAPGPSDVATVTACLRRRPGLEARTVRGPLAEAGPTGRFAFLADHLQKMAFMSVGYRPGNAAHVFGYGLTGSCGPVESLCVRHKLGGVLRNGKPRFTAAAVDAALAVPRPCVVLCLTDAAFEPGRENGTRRAMELVTWGLERAVAVLPRAGAGRPAR